MRAPRCVSVCWLGRAGVNGRRGWPGGPGQARSTIRLVSSLDILASRLPDGTVSTDPQTLREHAIDSWSLALLRRVRGDDLPEPAAVVFPARTEEVATVLAWASRDGHRGHPEGRRLRRLRRGAGARRRRRRPRPVPDGPHRRGRRHLPDGRGPGRGARRPAGGGTGQAGLTTGHYPQSIAISTVGGWIAASSAGQASTGFGAIEDVLLGLTAVLPDGEILRLRPVPRSAAGPDLRRLLIGSEGTLAVVTEATLACRARPTAWDWLAFGFPDFTTMAEALRDVKRAETGAAVLRGYDETDAQLGFGALDHTTGCVALAGFPAGPPGLDARKQAAAEILRRHGDRTRRPLRRALVAAPQRRGADLRADHGAGADVRHRGDRGHDGGRRALVRGPAALRRASEPPCPRTPRRWPATCPTCTRPARRCTSPS